MDKNKNSPEFGIVANLVTFYKNINSEQQPGSTAPNPKDNKKKQDFPIGIDLGTKHCCVGVSVNEKIQIIPNSSSKNTTPSYVSFKENGSIDIGDVARRLAWKNPKYTIFDSKRMIGRTMDKTLQETLKDMPFQVFSNNKGQLKIQVPFKTIDPEEVSAKLVKYCVELAEKHLKEKVTTAVITIPAYFNDNQKQATVKAGYMAGLQRIDLLQEPTAAAIAYRFNRVHDEQKRVLVFDLGAGTFDIAVVDVMKKDIRIVGHGGDTFLGGDDFDAKLIDYCIDEFNKDHGVNIRDQKSDDFSRTLINIRDACERAKIDLSNSDSAIIEVQYVFNQESMFYEITKAQYETLIQPLVQKTIEIVEKTLQELKIDKKDIEDIVLVGGSTRTPMIQNALRQYFGKDLNEAINPDDAVAYGAAVHAACEHNETAKKSFGIELVQVVPISFGVKSVEGENCDNFVPIICKGMAYPVKNKEMAFRTHEDDQTKAIITIFQGEDAVASKNTFIGEFELTGIPKNKAGEEHLTIYMSLDKNGLLQVRATSHNGSSSNHIEIKISKM